MTHSLVQMPATVVGLSCLRTEKLVVGRRDEKVKKFFDSWNKIRKVFGQKTLTDEEAEAYFEGGEANFFERSGYFLVAAVGRAQQARLKSLMSMARAAPPGGPMLVSEEDFRSFKEGFDELVSEAKTTREIEKLGYADAESN